MREQDRACPGCWMLESINSLHQKLHLWDRQLYQKSCNNMQDSQLPANWPSTASGPRERRPAKCPWLPKAQTIPQEDGLFPSGQRRQPYFILQQQNEHGTTETKLRHDGAKGACPKSSQGASIPSKRNPQKPALSLKTAGTT